MQLYKQLRKWSDLFPEKIAFSCGNEQLTYRQLHEMSESLAYYLNEFLPNDSTPIVVYGHMEPLMLVCLLASVNQDIHISLLIRRFQKREYLKSYKILERKC
ncbi:acyl-coenzyme A synthetase/AMP-(fatty) acid ligase [Neobacillus drentensis]|nr:acyl-coenzyme A synthetase/AMP-(fatty) acid ligase [Neobacillus drentensis]